MSEAPHRRTQEDRRASTRGALMVATAQGLASYGYANLTLEHVARDAGFTRGALYHQFANKEELTIAVVRWVADTWDAEVRRPALAHEHPLERLLALAYGHVLYCRRRDGARAILALRVELSGQDHPVANAMHVAYGHLEAECSELIRAGRRSGAIPHGPPSQLTAAAFLAALESVGIEVAGNEPHDVELVRRAAQGILGTASHPAPAHEGSAKSRTM